MEDESKDFIPRPLTSEGSEEIKKCVSVTTSTPPTSTCNTVEDTDRSVVIFVQQQQEGELSVPLLTTSAEQQLVTLVPQNFAAEGISDVLPSLTSSVQTASFSEEMGAGIVNSLLGSEEQQQTAFQTEDGHILYVTYTVNPTLPTLDERDTTHQSAAAEGTQRMVLHLTEDGNAIVLPSESVEVGGFDIIGGSESGIMPVIPHLTVNGVYSIVTDNNLTEETLSSLVQTSSSKELKEAGDLKEQTFLDFNNQRRTEHHYGNDLHIEDKLEVLDAMLTPAPERPRKKKPESGVEDGEGSYMCDLCEITFSRAAQFYGHLHCHSGERKWECSVCPDKAVFVSQSQLRRHEKESHLNLRPHVCKICSARFDRVSQLSYHQRRIHVGERAHACQICNKAFFKRSDLKTHLNIHLGINKCICETCGKKFNHVSNLIRHTRMHSGIKPYPCNICGRRFSQLNALNQHKTSHQTNKDVSCSICRKMFKSHMVMRKHVRQIHKDKLVASGKDINSVLKMKDGVQTRRYYCKVCGEKFEFAALLKQHERQHEKENNFHCNCCGQDYDSIEQLKSHACQTPEERLQKEAEDEAEAERVALNTQLESFLQEHSDIVGDSEERNNENGNGGLMGDFIIYVTQEGQDEPTQVHIKPVTESIIGQSDTSKPLALASRNGANSIAGDIQNQAADGNGSPAVLRNSRGTSKDKTRISTNLCGDNTNDNFISGNDVLAEPSHDSDGDNGTSGTKDVASNNRIFINVESPSEGEKKPSKDELSRSVEKDPLALPETTTPSSGKKQARVYQCPECPKSFQKNSNFRQHLGIHFIDQQRYRCQTCGQSFAWKSTLNKHMLYHSTGPPPRYRCELCDKEYGAATQVQEHIKRDHYKQRPHSCLVCQKSFYKKYDLKIHLRTHTKERPYVCGTCGKSFYHLSHIIRHERIHSGHKPYRCQDCGRQFNQSSSLKCHRQRNSQCIKKITATEITLNSQEMVVQPDFSDMGPDAVLLYAGADL